MGKHSRKENKGKGYRLWRSSAQATSVDSRQQKRARKRAEAWAGMSGEQALRDEDGIIPRRIRRDMARKKAANG